MGAITSRAVGTSVTDTAPRGETNLKLEAQKIKDFTGGHEDWQKWKSRTECAFSGSGYERVLEDTEYAMSNERLNKVVYSQLAAATVDGVAYHLVQQFESDKNGHAAWKNLCEWYDGDMIMNETAENLRNKLDNLRLHTGVSGSEYVNKFLAWYRDLDKIKGEGLSKGHATHLFLKNITDSEYQSSVTYCRNTDCSLEKCIAAVRKQERDIQQKKLDRHRLKATLRRMRSSGDSDMEDEAFGSAPKRSKLTKPRRTGSTNSEKVENKKFEGELDTTERGLLRFHSDCWKTMDEKEKDFVRDYNATIKHGDPIDKVIMPPGISIKTCVRRTQVTDGIKKESVDEPKHNGRDRKKKGVTFGISEEDHADPDDV
jgi:hypothetical protein